ncbi:MAG: A/G-specific adenine glycosylase [Bacteroidota bacterium]|nr:A/G-specific adenine glycosylase [Bacteroidota bacterium]
MDFTTSLIKWYENDHRLLPWRETSDPYFIWLSEVILQQTRIDQGTNYYIRFIEHFPTLKDLASASEDEVLKLWQGLGYYSRARNLHFAAKFILNSYNGQFPDTYDAILSLKGVGEYTASAIASIAFNLPYAAIDGNVYRVLSRFTGLDAPIDTGEGKKMFRELANHFLDQKNPGIYNQAVMELGAVVCTPQSPDCKNCPLNDSCVALRDKTISMLPVKIGRTVQRNRYFNYLDITSGSHTFIHQRKGGDIWHGLFEFPLIETVAEIGVDELILNKEWGDLFDGIKPVITGWERVPVHLLSHLKIYTRFIRIDLPEEFDLSEKYRKVLKKDIFKFAVPRLVERYLINRYE